MKIVQLTKEWKQGHRSGIQSVVEFLKQWDRQLAPVLGGRKMSSIVLCKFNLTGRRVPEKVKIDKKVKSLYKDGDYAKLANFIMRGK